MTEQTDTGSEPLHITSLNGLPVESLTVHHVAALVHRAYGTLGDVSLHPRGCGSCEKAVRIAGTLGLPIPPLYEDEFPPVPSYLDCNGTRQYFDWFASGWTPIPLAGAVVTDV